MNVHQKWIAAGLVSMLLLTTLLGQNEGQAEDETLPPLLSEEEREDPRGGPRGDRDRVHPAQGREARDPVRPQPSVVGREELSGDIDPGRLLLSDDLLQEFVLNEELEQVGEIEDLLISPADGTIIYWIIIPASEPDATPAANYAVSPQLISVREGRLIIHLSPEQLQSAQVVSEEQLYAITPKVLHDENLLEVVRVERTAATPAVYGQRGQRQQATGVSEQEQTTPDQPPENRIPAEARTGPPAEERAGPPPAERPGPQPEARPEEGPVEAQQENERGQ